uniref:DNA-binding protein HEXBP n=2 Tax=Lygus hesperus TaxID=30085 RepID=A0A0A9YIB1_LYGHE
MSKIEGSMKRTGGSNGVLETTMRKIEGMVSLTLKQYMDIGKLMMTGIMPGECYECYSETEEMSSSIVAMLAEAFNLALKLEVAANSRLISDEVRQKVLGDNSARKPEGLQWMSRSGPKNWEKTHRHVVCWKCNGVGHISRGCTLWNTARGKQRWTRKQDNVCWNCGIYGHLRWNCRRGSTNYGIRKKMEESGRGSHDQAVEETGSRIGENQIGRTSTSTRQEIEEEQQKKGANLFEGKSEEMPQMKGTKTEKEQEVRKEELRKPGLSYARGRSRRWKKL